MSNVRLSNSRQRFGNGLIYTGCFIGGVGWIAARILFDQASIASVVVSAFGALIVFAGMAIVTNKVVCPKCRRSCWIIGKETRTTCGWCDTPYFDET
jgi:ribosomal protein S27AE